MSPHSPLRLGLFGIGLDTYWPQFKGLKSRLMGYQRLIAERLVGRASSRAGSAVASPQHGGSRGRSPHRGVQLVDAGLVDSPAKTRAASGY